MLRHFWFTDEDGNNIMFDHTGTLDDAITLAEDYLKLYPECDKVYINENDDIVEVVFR